MLAILLALTRVSSPTDAMDLHSETVRIVSGSHVMTVDIARPSGSARHAAVVLLHGRGGMTLYGGEFRQHANELAQKGFTVLMPHYFDASASADSPEVTAALFEIWRKAVSDVVGYAAARDDVHACCIGLVGVSLGGYLAAVEAVQDYRVTALVSESAGVSTWFPPHPNRMPPLLIVHSRHDPIVPLSEAMHLAEIARSLKTEPEVALYDDTEHVLTGRTARAANARIDEFLADALRLPDP